MLEGTWFPGRFWAPHLLSFSVLPRKCRGGPSLPRRGWDLGACILDSAPRCL